MELIDFPIRLSKWNKKVYIHCFGDIHRAAAGCDSRALRSDINRLKVAREKGELHYWMGTGDWSNSIGPKDKRYDSTAVAPEFREYQGQQLFQAEARKLISEFTPIKEWCIGIGSGNHEETIAKNGEFHPSIYIAEQLGVPFMGYSAGIRISLYAEDLDSRCETLLVYFHHGRGAARTKGAKVNMLWGMRDVVDADVFVVGHVHEEVEFPDVSLTMSRKGTLRLIARPRMFINSGTYLKSAPTSIKAQKAGQFDPDHHVHTDYAEMAAFRPSVIGHNGWAMRMKAGTQKGKTVWGIDLRKFDPRSMGESA